MQHRYVLTITGLCILGICCALTGTDADEPHNKEAMAEVNVKNPVSENTTAIVASVGPPGTPTPRIEVPEWWRQRHESMNARVKQGNVDLMFIGDSITQRWEQEGRDVWERRYRQRHAVNLGIDGDRTQQVLWRLDHGNIDGIAPKLAVLMIGTNNILGAPVEDVAQAIQAVVGRLRTKLPVTNVLVLGILPRTATNGDKEEDVRRMITETNDRIAMLADDKMVFFLDLGPEFRSKDGTLLKEAFAPDMVHLAPRGYELWAEAIESTVARLMNEDDSSAHNRLRSGLMGQESEVLAR